MRGKDATALRSFVQDLDRFDRLVLLMHFVDGLSPAEIAAVLDWSDLKVAKALSRLRDEAMAVIRTFEPEAEGVTLSSPPAAVG